MASVACRGVCWKRRSLPPSNTRYVQGCKRAVQSYDEMERVHDIGNSNRTVRATLMNAYALLRLQP